MIFYTEKCKKKKGQLPWQLVCFPQSATQIPTHPKTRGQKGKKRKKGKDGTYCMLLGSM